MPLCAECKAPTCWTERTKLEKWLIPSLILIGALVLALTLTCFYLAGWFTKSTATATPNINEKDKKSDFHKKSETISSNDDNVCKTPSCMSAATKILEYIDPTISPCENFYDFACGNFIKTKIIPEDQPYIDMSSIVEEKLLEQLKNVLEAPLEKGEPKAFHVMQKYYKACMDTAAIEKNGLDTIRKILQDLGGWPILEGANWVESKFDWKELTYKLHSIGFVESPLFRVIVVPDWRNPDRNVLTIVDEEASFLISFSQRLWTEEDVHKAYFQYMVDAAVLLGADQDKSMKEIKDMFEFGLKLGVLKEQRQVTSEFISVNQFQQNIPNFSWLDYINKLLAPHLKISGDETVLIIKQDYFKDLFSLLPTISKRTLANYLLWTVVELSTEYSTKALMEARLRYKKVSSGVATQPARWNFCVNRFMNGAADEAIETKSLWIGLGALYVRKYFSKKSKQEAHDMILNIHHIYQDTLKNLDWMDDKTKKNALDKLEAMGLNTAFPDEFLDDKKLEEYFGDLDLDDNNFHKSHLKLYQFDIKNYCKKLREPIDKYSWLLRGQLVIVQANAAYNRLQNQIHVPAAILQGTFDISRPHYLNYGAIGIVVGHEITHGFDSTGSKRDKDGKEADWWTPKTKDVFLQKSQCFVEQFDKYVLPDLNLPVNGRLTLAENIADSGGLTISYKAYQELIKKQGCDQTLPGINYTQNQLFWIAGAHNWCSKMRPEHQQGLMAENTHAPDRFRVLGLVSNNMDFSKDFRCSSKSKMNPKHKCKLW